MDAYERLAVLQLIGVPWRPESYWPPCRMRTLSSRERRTLRDIVTRSYGGRP